MKTLKKMPSAARRQSIIDAVRKVFAGKGFHGVTSRELANAAGISEALLFRHFPTKDALYAAIHESWHRQEDLDRMAHLDALENTTANLVLLVQVLASEMFKVQTSVDAEEGIRRQLFLRSITEDGELVRIIMKGMPTQWVQKTEKCLQAAVAAGDAAAGPGELRLQGWFVHHLAVMIAIHLLPETPIVDYEVSREKLMQQMVWFALRGLGVKDEAIARHYTHNINHRDTEAQRRPK